jgi:hypothetical protein
MHSQTILALFLSSVAVLAVPVDMEARNADNQASYGGYGAYPVPTGLSQHANSATRTEFAKLPAGGYGSYGSYEGAGAEKPPVATPQPAYSSYGEYKKL